MKGKIYQIINGKVLTPSGWLKKGCVVLKDGKIAEVSTTTPPIEGAIVIDAAGLFVTPGCIDMHVYGGGGHDFLEATPEAFNAVTKAHALHGTTALYATLAVFSPDVLQQAIQTCEYVQAHPTNGASILGLHLEGNYLNEKMKGGQPPEYISLPCPEEYKAILDSTSCIKRWSAAPELPGALDFAGYVSQRGIVVSLAHTTAGYKEVKAGYEAGFTHVTHFYNAMTGLHKDREYKHEGTIESIYLMDGMTVEVIADSIHVPPALLKLVHKFKGVERTALVTDSMAAGACRETSRIFDPRVIIEDGVCKLADHSALAGSIATADRLIRTMVEQAEIPLEDAVRMASETPARIMGILDRKGTIEPGKDADIIIFDEDINIKDTFVEGKKIL